MTSSLQSDVEPLKSTNSEEKSVADCCGCANDRRSHDHRFCQQCGHALSVETANAHMDQDSLDNWENWLVAKSPECSFMGLEATSQSQAPDIVGVSSLANFSCINTLFIEPSPAYSNACRHDSYPLDSMNNPFNDYLDINMCMHDNASNSMGVSTFSPSNGNAMVMSTGVATSGDGSFDDEAAQKMDEMRAIKNPIAYGAREVVRFLVESSTPTIDDGYKWCKYGQKPIKGKVYPRCYFRCAQRGCFVKKQIEGSSGKPGFVSITYFGKHNHYV